MSSREDRNGPERAAFQSLEAAVGRAVDELERLRREADEARTRSAELEEMLAEFQQGERDPVEMAERLGALERENADLRERVSRGREGVERLLARIRFLEDQR